MTAKKKVLSRKPARSKPVESADREAITFTDASNLPIAVRGGRKGVYDVLAKHLAKTPKGGQVCVAVPQDTTIDKFVDRVSAAIPRHYRKGRALEGKRISIRRIIDDNTHIALIRRD